MATLNSFQDLECWKLARKTANSIYNYFGQLRDFGFRDQILRASVSVMNNIAEGFGRTTAKGENAIYKYRNRFYTGSSINAFFGNGSEVYLGRDFSGYFSSCAADTGNFSLI